MILTKMCMLQCLKSQRHLLSYWTRFHTWQGLYILCPERHILMQNLVIHDWKEGQMSILVIALENKEQCSLWLHSDLYSALPVCVLIKPDEWMLIPTLNLNRENATMVLQFFFIFACHVDGTFQLTMLAEIATFRLTKDILIRQCMACKDRKNLPCGI